MTKNSLIVTLDGPRVGDTVLVEDLKRVLDGVSTAMRLMVGHLGGREPGPGQPPAWIREQSHLRMPPTRPGSCVAEFIREPLADTQMRMESHGEQAFAALREWDGSEGSTLPGLVTDCLYDTAGGLSGSTRLWFGNKAQARRIEVRRPQLRDRVPAEEEAALLQGWLREVNWDKGTAQLHDYASDYVHLRFGPSLAEDMLRLATQYVEVPGRGSFSQQGEWKTIDVQQLSAPRSSSEPFDLDAFLNDPDAKVFDPAATVTVDLTEEEWESFNRAIREGREV